MTDIEQREAARQFHNKWHGRGNEDQDGRSYWLDILTNILGIENATDRVDFEKRVKVDGNTKKIDVYIPETKTIIEQKSLGIALDKPGHQSGGIELTPYQQAKRYNDNLPLDEKAKWIVTSNFAEIWIYDMNTVEPEKSVKKISLDEIQGKFILLDFLVNKGVKQISHEMEISMQAGEIVGVLYEALLAQYDNPTDDELKSLNMLCVRLVFCLYAEDAGVFGKHTMFHDYLQEFDARHTRKALVDLFEILNTKIEDRDKYLEPELAQFPYVNGGLFSDNSIAVPPITEEIRALILKKSSEDFDWSQISPTIFGAVFESTLNPETRRSGGMHYTSVENIHKVIDPLFLDDLYSEFNEIKQSKQVNKRKQRLEEFCEKLGSLKFLDPACGSGNFLTETYISLRKLENKALEIILSEQVNFEDFDKIKVTIDQFYGIEINDFAVNVAKTALWIAESQMIKETESIISRNIEFLPLTTNAYIVEANALKIDWNDVVPQSELNYIMGNPPFVGARWMNKEQKEDLLSVFGNGWKNAGDLDYVCCWYKKCCDYIQNTNIKCALVSTNSVSQGGSVVNLWKPLFEYGLVINFAYRSFVWQSEAKTKAQVHCVIIGFSMRDNGEKYLFENGERKIVSNINGYLLEAVNIFIEKRSKPLSNVPEICLGGQAIDDGNLILTEEDKSELLKKEPQASVFIRHYMMGKDFINRNPRYCLWLKNADPTTLKKCSLVLERVRAVREFRLSSTRNNTLKAAETPTLFATIVEPVSDYVAIPKVSSENRRYVPIDFLSSEIIPGDKIFMMQGATVYEFGVLTSNVHMAWLRAVCGRLKSDYSYSNTIVYNNFPWCNPTDEQKAKIEQTAQAILDARAKYPDCSLADLYDELTMPIELRKAHQANDRAVMDAYGFTTKMSEAECVAELMKMYQALVK